MNRFMEEFVANALCGAILVVATAAVKAELLDPKDVRDPVTIPGVVALLKLRREDGFLELRPVFQPEEVLRQYRGCVAGR